MQESWDITLTIADSGTKHAVIKAGHAREYQEGRKKEQNIDQGISVVFFDRQGNNPTTMTAGRALVHSNQDIEAFDSVIIRSSSGTVVRTNYIKRTSADRMLRSNNYVTVTTPRETIRGFGFACDENLNQYRIFHASGQAISQ